MKLLVEPEWLERASSRHEALVAELGPPADETAGEAPGQPQ